jgi:hypothetical protein
MDEKEKLLDALKRAPETEWKIAAQSPLQDPQVVFAGSPGSAAISSASDLLRIYRIRLDQCREHAIRAHGIYELIESLARIDPDSRVRLEPFLGPQNSITAFWDVLGNLVGCITVIGPDPERGLRNLDFALGKR